MPIATAARSLPIGRFAQARRTYARPRETRDSDPDHPSRMRPDNRPPAPTRAHGRSHNGPASDRITTSTRLPKCRRPRLAPSDTPPSATGRRIPQPGRTGVLRCDRSGDSDEHEVHPFTLLDGVRGQAERRSRKRILGADRVVSEAIRLSAVRQDPGDTGECSRLRKARRRTAGQATTTRRHHPAKRPKSL
jgi:hypothetical protein